MATETNYGPFDQMYENVGADKAYYMACAFTASNTPSELYACLRMLRAVGQCSLSEYLDGCYFSDPNGWDDADYGAIRDLAWGFREYMGANPGLCSWMVQL